MRAPVILLGSILALALSAAAAGAVPFMVDTTNRVIETSKLKIQFGAECPESVVSLYYKPFSTATPINGESLPVSSHWVKTSSVIVLTSLIAACGEKSSRTSLSSFVCDTALAIGPASRIRLRTSRSTPARRAACAVSARTVTMPIR